MPIVGGDPPSHYYQRYRPTSAFSLLGFPVEKKGLIQYSGPPLVDFGRRTVVSIRVSVTGKKRLPVPFFGLPKLTVLLSNAYFLYGTA